MNGATVPGPEALWGIGQIATYLGRGKETVRGWWQAARARAGDPDAAAAADALPPPDFLSPQDPGGIAGFFAPPVPEHAVPTAARWWTSDRVRPLWRPPVIVAWALTTGRTTADGALGWERRLPVPMFADLPALSTALLRVLDEVVQLPPLRPGDGRAFTAHLRIWEGALPLAPGADSAPPRTVVLLSPAVGPPPPLTHAEDLAARALAAGCLTASQACRALWFLQGEQLPEPQPDGSVALRPPVHYLSFAVQPGGDDGPGGSGTDDTAADAPPALARLGHRVAAALQRRLDGAPAGPLRSLRVLPAALEHIDHLVGERVEVYPDGTCTADAVARFAAGHRPVPLAWDPAELAADLTHLPVLVAARPASLADTTGQAAYRAAVYRAAAHWVAAHADLVLLEYRLGLPGLDRDAVHRQTPQLDLALTELLETTLADTEEHPYGIGILLRDLTTVRHLIPLPHHNDADSADSAAADRTPGPATQDALTAALRHASDRIKRQYHQVTAHIAEHHTIPVRLPDGSSTGPDPHPGDREPATYLDTVSWWGPRTGDHDAAQLLAGMFFDHERAAGLRHGYDPFGRLVLHCATAHAFAVQWPATAAPAADEPITPTYQPLPDGRVDLIPLTGTGTGTGTGTEGSNDDGRQPDAPTSQDAC